MIMEENINITEKTNKPAKIKLHWSRRRKKPYNHSKNFKQKPSNLPSIIHDISPNFEANNKNFENEQYAMDEFEVDGIDDVCKFQAMTNSKNCCLGSENEGSDDICQDLAYENVGMNDNTSYVPSLTIDELDYGGFSSNEQTFDYMEAFQDTTSLRLNDDFNNEILPLESLHSDSPDDEDIESLFSDSSYCTSCDTDTVLEDPFFDAVDDDNLDSSGETLTRIVDLSFLFEQIREMNNHSKTCNFNDMKLIESQPETKYGFICVYNFMCSKCSYISKLKTSQRSGPYLNLNYAAVLGSLSIGIGYSQLQEFTATLGIPCMSQTTYTREEKQLSFDVKEAAEQCMKDAALEEKRLLFEKGSFDEKGRARAKCTVDAAWNKRSYKSNYSAPSGTATIIGYETNKVLWNGVANKYCAVCQKIENDKEPPHQHECNRNYSGPSTGMEPKLLVTGFKECEERYQIRFMEMIADGDSSVITELHASNIYRDPIEKTEKTECTNHIFRNTRGGLRKIGKTAKLKDYITPHKIEEIIKGIRSARMHWFKTDLPHSAKVENVRNDIYNAPFHVFGSHDNCAEYFCKKKYNDEENFVLKMQSDGTWNQVIAALSRVRLNAKSILAYENTNIVEQFNALVAKYCGGKRINFAKSTSYWTRVLLAVIQQNTKRMYTTLCNFLNVVPHPICNQLEFKRLHRNLNRAMIEKPFTAKKITATGNDQYYTNSSIQVLDMNDVDFQLEKKKFIDNLTKQQFDRIKTERDTVGQIHNNLWKQLHASLLTSSNFGKVCNAKSPESFAGIVKSVVYEDVSSSKKQINHSDTYDSHAISKLEEIYKIKVEKCGLFIDKDHYMLGATPAGLVANEDAIVEVKCPILTHNINIEKAILDGKLPFFKRERMKKNVPNFVPKIIGINTRHHWYYQVQGQLHITQKKFCYFVLWAADTLPIRIEKIFRDDTFWIDKMETKLLNFFNTAMLPELVDPRKGRSMNIRKFDKEGTCIF